MGADGIYLWNLATSFQWDSGQDLIATRNEYYSCLKDLGDPKTLDGKDKLFCVDTATQGMFPAYAHISSLPPLPVISKRGPIKHGVVQRVPLMVGDNFEMAARGNRLRDLRLMIGVRGPVSSSSLVFRLNGEILTGEDLVLLDADKSEYQINYSISAPPLRKGKNFLEIALESAPPGLLEFYSIRLRADYR
jgi:hypothetical protein